MTHSLDRWLDMADGKLRGGAIPCILNGGNDDIFEIDPILESAPSVTFAEGKVIDLAGSGFTMISMGYTNPTPWDTHREAPEDELAARIDAIAARVPDMNRTIFNFHAPPYGTGLDEAPELDATMRPTHGGAVMKPVGLHRRPRRDPAIPAAAFRSRAHSRKPRRGQAGPDPHRQPRQLLRGRRASGRPHRHQSKKRKSQVCPS